MKFTQPTDPTAGGITIGGIVAGGAPNTFLITDSAGNLANYGTTNTINAASSPYTVPVTDQIILADTSAGDITITLPLTSAAIKRDLYIVKTSALNNLYINAAGSDFINDTTALQLTDNRQAVYLASVQSGQWNALINFAQLPTTLTFVKAASSAVLPGVYTYNNGAGGVGATLTKTTNGVFASLNGVALSAGDRVLLKNQSSALTNGVYELTDPGSAGTPTIFTRATDADQTSELDPQIVEPTLGTSVNKGKQFSQTTANPTVGTSSLVYVAITPGVVTNGVTQQTSGTQAIGQMPFWTASARELSKGNTTSPFWDNTNQFFGVGVNTPAYTIDAFGTNSNGPLTYTPFGAPGLNDASLTGTYSGNYANIYNVTIANKANITYNTLVGNFQAGDTVTGGTSGATATVVVDNGTTNFTMDNVTDNGGGLFVPFETITGAPSGATAVVVAADNEDQISWNKNGISFVLNQNIQTGGNLLDNGVTIQFVNISGHTIGDLWSFTPTVAGNVNTSQTYLNAGLPFGTVDTGYNIYLGGAGEFVERNNGAIAQNVLIGKDAGKQLRSNAVSNTYIGGFDVGSGTTTGSQNTAIGDQSAIGITTAIRNTIVGAFAGAAIDGDNNTLIGYNSMFANTSGIENVVLGSFAGASMAAGSQNVLIGMEAATNSSTFSGTVSIGFRAGFAATASDSVFIGKNTGSQVTGSGNTLVGGVTGVSITTGFSNTLLGENVGNTLATGDRNTLIGRTVAPSMDANDNTFVGFGAAPNLTAGARNTGIGSNVGAGTTVAAVDNFLGGYSAGANLSTGFQNVILGSSSASTLTSGSSNTVVGFQADVAASTTVGAIAIGAGSIAPTNAFVAGSGSAPITDVYFGEGITDATPAGGIYTIHGTGGVGTNISAAKLILAGGIATGTGTPGSVVIQTSDPIASGSSVQALKDIHEWNATTSISKKGQRDAIRVVTAAGAVTVVNTDYIVVVNKTVGAATVANLPAGPTAGDVYIVKDGKGDAAANNITVTPAAGNIDGAGTYVMNVNYQSVTVVYNGTQWNII